MLTSNRADIERTVSNVRDATDWGDKLVQKIYANPFVLSPFYKPTPEDVRVQTVYDTAQVFTKGAQELNDLVKTLDAMQARPQTPQQQQEIAPAQAERSRRSPTGSARPRNCSPRRSKPPAAERRGRSADAACRQAAGPDFRAFG